MSVTVTKTGPYYSSGSISFSSLRTNFKEVSSGSISASTLRRNTDVNETNPIVPDSTENEQISTGSNLKLSQFRNSIKRYSATQSGTDNNYYYPDEPGFRMGRYDLNGRGIDWCGGGYYGRDGQGGGTTGNLTKNVQKFIYITGTCYSDYYTSPGAQLAPDPAVSVYNVTIDVSGEIYGAGGQGGYNVSISGEPGGDALNVYTTNGGNINIIVESSAKIYGGGGGGELGATGARGDTGTCWDYSYKTAGSGCDNCGDCGSGWERYGGCSETGGCSCGGWWLWYGCKHSNYTDAECRQPTYFQVAGGAGGAGGPGGHGQGYTTARTDGLPGSVGSPGSCDGYTGTGTTPGTGKIGETGGNGGDWGQSGGDTTNSGSGGPAGKAINGNKHKVSGTISSNTVKGLYI